MSGFITTMFVSAASDCTPTLSSKPKPLPPILAQNHNNLDVAMISAQQLQLGHGKDIWTETSDGSFEALAPARPQSAYKSPLQRIGEALRTPRVGLTPSLDLEAGLNHGVYGREPGFPPPTPYSSPLLPPSGDSHASEQYSYQLVPGGRSPSSAKLSTDHLGHPRQGYGIPASGYIASPSQGRGITQNLGNDGVLSQRLSLHSSLSSNPRTRAPFKPQKSGRGTSSWQLKQYAEATLGSGSLRKAVKLPEGEDKDEWLAVNIVDFYNQINLLYGSITEFCSPQTCPEMKATDEFEYLWQDSENFKKPTKMPAPEYIEHLMAWVQSNIDNEQMFPSRIGVPFPKTFPALLRNIFKRLYRVYAHIYCHHYPVIIELGLEPHLNTSFKHYVLFIDEHGLASGSKDFWGPLGDLVESMLRSD